MVKIVRYVRMRSTRFFMIGLCVLVLWSLFGILLFSSREREITFITNFRVHSSKKFASPLTKYLLEIHRNNFGGKKRFTSVLGPLGAGGTGNHHMGITNMILYSIFTNSSILIPANSYFHDSEHSFVDYFHFNSLELENYIVHPSPYHRVNDIVHEMKQNCATSYFFRTSSMSTLDEVIENYPSRYIYRRIKYVVPEIPRYEKDGDNHAFIRACDDELCKEFFVNEKTRNKVFHEPRHITSSGANIGCFPTYMYYYWVFHIFRSKEKMDFLCDILKLCEGIDRTFVERNCHSNACQFEGLLLMGNIFRSLFQINEIKANQLLGTPRELSVEKDRYTKIGVHVRTIMAGFTSNEYQGILQVGECIGKVMEYMNKEDISRGRLFKVFLAGDSEFKVNKKFLQKLNDTLSIEKRKYPSGLFDSVLFETNQVGEKYMHGFWVDENMTKKKKNKRAKKDDDNEDLEEFGVHNQLFLDIYKLSLSDVLIMTQYSSFSALVGSFGRSMLRHRFFLFPLAGKGFLSEGESVETAYLPCSNKIPFQPCKKEVCPVDYL